MGNLRDRYTIEEWDELENKVISDRRNGKPDEIFLPLSIWHQDAKELIKLKKALLPFYSEHNLSLLDKWIAWQKKQSNKCI